MRRFYLVSVVGKGFDVQHARRVRYFHTDYPAGHSALVGMRTLYYGHLPVCLVDCPNMDETTHAELVVHSDVDAFPKTLNQVIGTSNLQAVKDTLESWMIPAQWVEESWTYLDILLRMEKLFIFASRFQPWLAHRLIVNFWDNDIALNDLPAFLIEDLQDAASTFGIDTSDIDGTWLIRDAVTVVSQRIEETQ